MVVLPALVFPSSHRCLPKVHSSSPGTLRSSKISVSSALAEEGGWLKRPPIPGVTGKNRSVSEQTGGKASPCLSTPSSLSKSQWVKKEKKLAYSSTWSHVVCFLSSARWCSPPLPPVFVILHGSSTLSPPHISFKTHLESPDLFL